MQEKFEKYLPIGTVVLLKGATKRLMIMGYCSSTVENTDKVFDYTACLYPEGYISPEQVCLFDHEQIEKIYSIGYIDEDERIFVKRLTEAVEAVNKGELTQIESAQQPVAESTVQEETVNLEQPVVKSQIESQVEPIEDIIEEIVPEEEQKSFININI